MLPDHCHTMLKFISIHNVLKAMKSRGKFLGRAAVTSQDCGGGFRLRQGSLVAVGSIFQQKDFQLAASKLLIEGEAGINLHDPGNRAATYGREHPEMITTGGNDPNIFPDNIIRAGIQSNVLQVVFFHCAWHATVTLPPKMKSGHGFVRR